MMFLFILYGVETNIPLEGFSVEGYNQFGAYSYETNQRYTKEGFFSHVMAIFSKEDPAYFKNLNTPKSRIEKYLHVIDSLDDREQLWKNLHEVCRKNGARSSVDTLVSLGKTHIGMLAEKAQKIAVAQAEIDQAARQEIKRQEMAAIQENLSKQQQEDKARKQAAAKEQERIAEARRKEKTEEKARKADEEKAERERIVQEKQRKAQMKTEEARLRKEAAQAAKEKRKAEMQAAQLAKQDKLKEQAAAEAQKIAQKLRAFIDEALTGQTVHFDTIFEIFLQSLADLQRLEQFQRKAIHDAHGCELPYQALQDLLQKVVDFRVYRSNIRAKITDIVPHAPYTAFVRNMIIMFVEKIMGTHIQFMPLGSLMRGTMTIESDVEGFLWWPDMLFTMTDTIKLEFGFLHKLIFDKDYCGIKQDKEGAFPHVTGQALPPFLSRSILYQLMPCGIEKQCDWSADIFQTLKQFNPHYGILSPEMVVTGRLHACPTFRLRQLLGNFVRMLFCKDFINLFYPFTWGHDSGIKILWHKRNLLNKYKQRHENDPNFAKRWAVVEEEIKDIEPTVLGIWHAALKILWR